MPERSGIDAAVCMPLLAGVAAGSTVCPVAGITAAEIPSPVATAPITKREGSKLFAPRRTALVGAVFNLRAIPFPRLFDASRIAIRASNVRLQRNREITKQAACQCHKRSQKPLKTKELNLMGPSGQAGRGQNRPAGLAHEAPLGVWIGFKETGENGMGAHSSRFARCEGEVRADEPVSDRSNL